MAIPQNKPTKERNRRLSAGRRLRVSSQPIHSGSAEKKDTGSGDDSEGDSSAPKSKRILKKDEDIQIRLIFVDGLTEDEKQDRLNRIAEVLFDSALNELRGGDSNGSK